ncbi:type IV secretion system DNA-binding domain-containing protein [Acidiferrobacter sp.]|uniref:type IV secretory system conjugative DNA transfer family protein n=1 Tax=Acidiferrobacter sp. TaxID=1872107 RepID=UPI0026128697|nr:type IV secretion system DNA-binding domain-containing protein [Acidiferrobacter sp.]
MAPRRPHRTGSAPTRAERRRWRALLGIGEELEARGLLDDAARLTAAIERAPPSDAARATLPAPWDGSGHDRRLTRPRRRWRPLGGILPAALAGAAPLLGLLRLVRGLWLALPKTAAPCAQTRLWLGTAGGLLHRRGLWRGIGRRPLVLTGDDLGQNLLVLGGIGSGKTTSVIQPALLQCLAQGMGGLVFDIKGDFGAAAAGLAQRTGRALTVIGPGRRAFNLLRGLTPEAAAGFLKSALLLNGTSGDPFWTETAVELCRNALGVLSFLPDRYSLAGLYDYLFQDAVRTECDRRLRDEAAGLGPEALRLLRSYQSYHEGVFTRFDAKVVAGVLASAAQVLTPFTHPALVDAFCPPTDALTIEALGSGAVVLVDLPLAVWGVGAKVVYTFIKLRFFQYMQRRPVAERSCPVLFLCDEYQEIVSANKDGLSDLNFWDKARAFGTIGIISAQSIASFYAAVGDRDLADTVLQNFRQKLCLRTEDRHTIEFFERVLGHMADRRRRVRPLVPATVVRRLHHRQALAMVSVAGEAVEEVIDLPAVFVGAA